MEFWQKYIVDNLYRPVTAVPLTIVTLVALEPLNRLLLGFGIVGVTRGATSLAIYFGVILTWLYYLLHLPRSRKNTIGIAVSIYCESKKQEIRLKNDFLRELKTKLGGLEEVRCTIVCLPNHLAESVVQSESPWKLCCKWNRKIKAQYFLYGSVKQRCDGGVDKYFIDLAGFVLHAPIPKETSTAIREDFLRILPTNVSFEETFELGGFKLTAGVVSHSVKLIVGIAAMVSGDLFLAHKLHTDLHKEVGSLPREFSILWKDRLSRFIDDEEHFIATYYNDTGNVSESKVWLSRLQARNPRHYSAWLLRAIHEFNDGRVNDAVSSVKQARQYAKKSHEWRYSLAFLYFWQGKYEDALIVCHAIEHGYYPGEDRTAGQVAGFVESQINLYPDKPFLHYWLGFIYYKKLCNLPKSLGSLERFVACGDGCMKKMHDKANTYLMDIRKQGGWQ